MKALLFLCALTVLAEEVTTTKQLSKLPAEKDWKIDVVATVDHQKIVVNVSTAKQCWRLVHDGTQVIALFEADGYTWTKNSLFCGTKGECAAQIEKLGLKPLPEPVPVPEPVP